MELNLNKFKERALTLDAIGLMYILVVGSLCYILPIPEMVKAFLALPGFLIIPYLVGKQILPQIKKLLSVDILLDDASNFILSWLLGLFIIWLLYTPVWLSRQTFILFILVLFFFVIVMKMYNTKFLNINYKIFEDIKIKRYNILVVLLIAAIFLSYTLSYYLVPNKGSYAQYIFVFNSLSILMGDDPMNPLRGSYFMYIPFLYGINSLIFNVQPYFLSATLPFFLAIIFISGIYKFTYQLTKNKRLSILSAFISIWIFECIYFKQLSSPIPRALLLSIFPWSLFLIQKYFLSTSTSKKIDIFLFIYSISLSLFLFLFFFLIPSFINTEYRSAFRFFTILTFFLIALFLYKRLSVNKNVFLLFAFIEFALISTHVNEGPLYMFLMFVYILSYVFLNNEKYYKKYEVFMILVIILIFLFVLLQYTNIISFKETSLLSESVFKHGVTEDLNMLFFDKYSLLKNSNSLIIWYFFLIGFIFAFFSKFKFLKAVAFSSVIMYSFYFFPENQFIRASIGQSIIFFSIVISFMIFSIQNILKKYFSNKYIFIVTFAVFIILVYGAVEPYLNDAEKLVESGRTVQMFEKYEVDAFQWIALNTPKNSIIFSDPYTSNSIKFISFRGNYFELGWISEIGYSNKSINNMDKMKEIFNTENGEEIHKKLVNFKREIVEQHIWVNETSHTPDKWVNIDSPIYIVVSGRTCEWLKSQKRITVTYSIPTNYEISESCINRFNDKRLFEQVYADNDKIYIFRVKKQTEQNESAEY